MTLKIVAGLLLSLADLGGGARAIEVVDEQGNR
jgi:hypothetical protein